MRSDAGVSRVRAARAVALVIAGLLVLAGCGVPTDEAPRVISAGNVPFGLLDAAPVTTSTTEPPADATGVADIYLLGSSDNAKLTPVQALVLNPPGPATALAALLQGPSTGQQGGGFLTFIPSSTRLNNVVVDQAGVATVNLSNDFITGLIPSEQILAVAQVVYTVTQFEGVTQVRFLIDGVPKDVPTQNGTLTQGGPVTRDDYATLALP
jgi:hypothetical protein